MDSPDLLTLPKHDGAEGWCSAASTYARWIAWVPQQAGSRLMNIATCQ